MWETGSSCLKIKHVQLPHFCTKNDSSFWHQHQSRCVDGVWFNLPVQLHSNLRTIACLASQRSYIVVSVVHFNNEACKNYKGHGHYLFGLVRFLALDIKSARFKLDLIWGQVIITVFHEDSEYVIIFAVPQTVGREFGESWVRVGWEFLSHINMYIKWKLRSF